MSLGAAREARGNAARLLKSGVDPALQARQRAAMRLEEAETTFEAVAREWHGQQVGSWVPRRAADVIKSLEQDVFPKIGALPIKGITYRIVDYKTGRLDPSIDYLMRQLRRSRAAIVHALARLKEHRFIEWIR